MKVTLPEATNTCKYVQICVVLNVGIDLYVHGVHSIWDSKSSTEYLEFVPVNIKIAFNDINQIIMLWTVHHLWSTGSCFVFKFYHQYSYLVLRNGDGTANILHSTEGVTQGDPLYMIDY